MAQKNKQTLTFKAEVTQLLHLIINKLYSDREIFLRELISNAADAIDKLRFSALSDEKLLEGDANFYIEIDYSPSENTLTIIDNGIGMSREEIADNLGKIAKSGTAEFLSALEKTQQSDASLIGQFGVGFYSAFMVAQRVDVFSRRAGLGEEESVHWSSEGDKKFSVSPYIQKKRGTRILLHLKEDAADFCQEWRLRQLVKKYADHLAVPVKMLTTDQEKEKATAGQLEVVNEAVALWTKAKNKITEKEYYDFYQYLTGDTTDPLAYTHHAVEGKLEYTSLLFIPRVAAFDLWQREQVFGLKLYIQRVFILDKVSEFLPPYLRFIKGILDSNDLSLNISREMLQQDAQVQAMRQALTKRVLDMLDNIVQKEPELYRQFWREYGQILKEGLADLSADRTQLLSLFRFASTHDDREEHTHSLEDYVLRMQKEQKNIYYLLAESFTLAKNSPHLEQLRAKGIEVLLLTDRIDEWVVSFIPHYNDKPFKNVGKGELEELAADSVEKSDEHNALIERLQAVLKDKIKEIRPAHRLVTSPACLVHNENDMSPALQAVMKASGKEVEVTLPILEINPNHQLIEQIGAEKDDALFAEWAWLLYEQSHLVAGIPLEDPTAYVQRANKFLMQQTTE